MGSGFDVMSIVAAKAASAPPPEIEELFNPDRVMSKRSTQGSCLRSILTPTHPAIALPPRQTTRRLLPALPPAIRARSSTTCPLPRSRKNRRGRPRKGRFHTQRCGIRVRLPGPTKARRGSSPNCWAWALSRPKARRAGQGTACARTGGGSAAPATRRGRTRPGTHR